MEHPKILYDAITFDDVLLIPARSDFIPGDADTHTRLTRSIEINIPLISAPMDTVTEAALAIALAQEGGIGIIHKNLSVEKQALEVEKLLLVDKEQRLVGMITMRDIDKLHQFPNACKDKRGRLRVGAATGVKDFNRVEALIKADVDVVVVDTAHGHSDNVLDTVREIKKNWYMQEIAGNIATAEGAKDLI